MMVKKISIIGAGVVGSAVGRLLRERGYEIKSVVSRGLQNAENAACLHRRRRGRGLTRSEGASGADWIFITTPDKAIRGVCEKIAQGGGFAKGSLAVHMSGALSSKALDAAREAGARALSVHPMQSLASSEEAVHNLPGSYFSIEGDAEAVPEGREIVEALGGLLLVIPGEEKALVSCGRGGRLQLPCRRP